MGIQRWNWSFDYGDGPVTLNGKVAAFTFDVPGTYLVTLTVTDIYGLTDIDALYVVVLDTEAPHVAPGHDIIVDQGTSLVLDGRDSTDNVGIASYRWTFDYNGSPWVLQDALSEFTFQEIGTYTITLHLTDEANNTASGTFNVTVRDSTSPVADAGEDITVDQQEEASIDGGASWDNVGVVSYRWTFDDQGEPFALDGVGAEHVFDEVGAYIITLMVTDAEGNRATDEVTVTVLDTTPPVAVTGLARTVDQREELTLDGTGSRDNVGVIRWTWAIPSDDGPIVKDGPVVSVTFQQAGVYTISLTVYDGEGNSDIEDLVVTVRDVTPPMADAGEDQKAEQGVQVDLVGDASSDTVGVTSWSWSFTYRGAQLALEGRSVNFTFDDPGTYVVTLRVVDAAGMEGFDQLNVTVEKRSTGDDIGEFPLLPVVLVVIVAIAVLAVVIWNRRRP